MDGKSSLFGIVGTITSSLIYLTPTISFLKILKNELRYKKYPGLVLVLSLMNCILWDAYGLIIDDIYIEISNSIGSIFLLVYITIYLFFLSKKNFKLSSGFSFFMILSVTFIMSLFYFVVPEVVTGIGAMVFNISLYIIPAKKIIKVIKKKNKKYIPFFSAILDLLNSTFWLSYAICKNKYNKYYNICLCQGVGLILSVLQIILYILYYKKKKK